jgi:predicted ATPase/DNA-binding SARP family transcriptional activator
VSELPVISHDDQRTLELRLLGPMEALVDGVSVGVSGPRRRALLIRLALSANEVVSKDRLVDDVWGEHPPPTAAKALHVHVSQLRDLLRVNHGVAAKDDEVLITRPTGYMLRLQPDAVDVARFEQRYADARRAFEHREHTRAAAICRDALSLWRGPALDDVSHEAFAVAEAARLEELRLATMEMRIEADLVDAGHVGVIGELETLVARHPLREHLWSLLALALYRSGRHAEAVRACTRLREILREELGLEPSLDITRLEHQIIVQDPQLELDGPGASVGSARVDRPDAVRSRTNLPRVATPFIAGDVVLEEIAERVRLASVVTLTGPGGVGKTRAAIEFGHRHLDEFDQGVFFVDLAPVSADEAIVGALASSLPLVVVGERSLLDAIVDWIGDRRVLLVIDNCEHLVAGVALLIEDLIGRCWNLRILATSREAIRVRAERVYPVPTLEASGPAVELFCDRARAVDVSFAVNGCTDALVQVCERLDGIPLALELAAARVRSLTVEEMLDRLHDRFRLLRSSGRSTLDRHNTLRATVAWSYQLLSPDEQLLFDRMSVFAGGFDLGGVETVCAFGAIDDVDIFELVSALVDKSMIVAHRGAFGTRYRLLETLRQYGDEQLALRHETAQLRDRHATYYADLAAELDVTIRGPRQVEGEARMAADWDNIRAAHLWSLVQADLELAERLAEGTFHYSVYGMGHDHAALLRRTVQLGEELDRPSSSMLGMLSYWTEMQGDAAEARRLAQRGLEVAPTLDHPDTAGCWWTLAGASPTVTPGSPEALAAFRHQAAAVANITDLDLHWWALACLTDASMNADPAASAALVQQLHETAARVQCPRLSLTALQHEVYAYLEASPPDYEATIMCYEDAAAIARATGDRQSLPLALRGLAMASTASGTGDALARCHDALIALLDIRHWPKIRQTLESATLALARAARTQQAAAILGYLDAHSPGFGIEHSLHFRDQARQLIDASNDHNAAKLHGAHLSAEELVANAIEACAAD